MATDLFLEMAELPATGSLGTGQLDTRDLLVAGVPISISSKYLYLYLELSGSTPGEGFQGIGYLGRGRVWRVYPTTSRSGGYFGG